jgi:hypothetical protein
LTVSVRNLVASGRRDNQKMGGIKKR